MGHYMRCCRNGSSLSTQYFSRCSTVVVAKAQKIVSPHVFFILSRGERYIVYVIYARVCTYLITWCDRDTIPTVIQHASLSVEGYIIGTQILQERLKKFVIPECTYHTSYDTC